MDLSKISHLEARQAVKAHFDSEDDFETEQQATEKVRASIESVRKFIRQKELELEAEHLKPLEAELEAIEKPFREKEQKRWDDLDAKLKALGVEAADFDLYDGWDGVSTCAVSGLPLMNEDELAETPSGDQFLFDLVPQKAEA
jgi:hypothetical protein